MLAEQPLQVTNEIEIMSKVVELLDSQIAEAHSGLSLPHTTDMHTDIVEASLDAAHTSSLLVPNIAVAGDSAKGRTRSAMPRLSDRQLEVLRLAARGLTNKQIGVILAISDRTVQNHLQNIFERLHVRSRTEAVTAGLRDHLISLEEAP